MLNHRCVLEQVIITAILISLLLTTWWSSLTAGNITFPGEQLGEDLHSKLGDSLNIFTIAIVIVITLNSNRTIMIQNHVLFEHARKQLF